ncbi:MAG: AAA family ATPase [Paludibacteraceae bacterium]|nr:AAA family ATPase [Paludibacteraceae bacterium]
MSEQKLFKFKGVIIKCTYNTPDYKIYAIDVSKKDYPDIKQNKYNNVSILGELSDLTLGVEYEITAEEQTNKYGTSYKVVNIKRDMPTTTEGTFLFLSEILTENQAKVLVENYPNIIQKVKDNDLDDIDLSKLKGIGEKTFAVIKEKIITNFALMDLVIEFKNVLSMSIIKKIYDEYSSIDKLKEKLKEEPYTSLTRISRIGFKTADSIILQLQKENIIDFEYDVKTSADRCLSCMLYLLEENENEGHTCMNLADLRQQCLKLVPSCADHFVDVIKNDNIYYNKEDMTVALRSTYETEEYIANTILANLNGTNNVWEFDAQKYKKVGEFELSDEQMQILDVICKNNIAILNGFAGAGKTASTQGIINMLKDNDKSFRLMSPTGRAAKVLHENTNEPASTIHRGLGYIPPNNWTYNKYQPLDCDVVIVDEFSMVDIWLFKRLLDAIDFKHTKLLIIGDNAQLPSVSCGNLLHDFMEANIIPTVTLNKIFRYSSGGLMRVATDTRCCKEYLTKDMKAKATTFGDNQDYMFIDLASELIPKNVVALYKKLLDNGNSIEDIQVLTAKNVGDCGSVQLNNMIQRVANPNYGSEVNMKVGDTTYYQGDLILQTVNNYTAELVNDEKDMNWVLEDEPQTAFVANGETAIIEEIYNTYIIANFNGIRVKYYRNDMNMVKLGYAISIHKSQGGGFKTVILCSPQSHIFMLNSNLLYVGLTRMKEKLYHLGSLQSVNQAVKKKANLVRHTFMQKLLKNSKNTIDI